MKNKKAFIFAQIVILSGLLFICLFCKYKEHNTEPYIRVIADQALATTLAKDLDLRKKASNQFFLFVQTLNSPPLLAEKGIEVKTIDHTYFIPHDSVLTIKETRDNDWQSNATQTVLAADFPIIPQQMDSIFQKELKQSNIHVVSLIKYTYKGHVSYNSPDTTLISYPIRTTEFKAGLANEITIQAFLRYPWKGYYKKAGTVFFWLFIGFLIFTTYTSGKKIKDMLTDVLEKIIKRRTNTLFDPSIVVEKKDKEIYQVNKEYVFDFNKDTLCAKGQEINITHHNSVILKALLDAPDCRMKAEELYYLLWGKDGTDLCRLYQVAQRLRTDVLTPVTNLTISSSNKKYQLCKIRPEDKVKKATNKKQTKK